MRALNLIPPAGRLICIQIASTAAAFAMTLTGSPADAAVPMRIVTASERETYFEIGRDLSRLIAAPAGIEMDALSSKGSADNVRRLRSEPGVRLALVQSDVYRAFREQVRAGDADAAALLKPLRALMPLYDEEVYVVVRADSPMKSFDDLRDKRINIGPLGGGTALTATTLYRTLFDAAPAERNISHLTHEQALLQLVSGDTLDAVVIVSGQPARLFSEMKPQARDFIKLLPLNRTSPTAAAVKTVYGDASIRAASYSHWLAQDVPTVAVKSILVTYDYQSPATRDQLTSFARSLCANADRLRKEGHPKWSEVRVGQPPLAAGWSYYSATTQILSRCDASADTVAVPAPAPRAGATEACTGNRALLGLCTRRPSR